MNHYVEKGENRTWKWKKDNKDRQKVVGLINVSSELEKERGRG